MARRDVRQMNYRSVSGSLAYDYERIEREERRRREREEREIAESVAREEAARRAVLRKTKTAPRHRERIRVSPAAVLGFVAVAAMAVMLLMSYAQLASISSQVVKQQKKLAGLEEEHVKLVSRYERTFDLSAIKEAAENAGMAKPSASQIYYIDLSEPDNIIIYEQEEESILRRVTASVGRNVASVVEYFK